MWRSRASISVAARKALRPHRAARRASGIIVKVHRNPIKIERKIEGFIPCDDQMVRIVDDHVVVVSWMRRIIDRRPAQIVAKLMDLLGQLRFTRPSCKIMVLHDATFSNSILIPRSQRNC